MNYRLKVGRFYLVVCYQAEARQTSAWDAVISIPAPSRVLDMIALMVSSNSDFISQFLNCTLHCRLYFFFKKINKNIIQSLETYLSKKKAAIITGLKIHVPAKTIKQNKVHDELYIECSKCNYKMFPTRNNKGTSSFNHKAIVSQTQSDFRHSSICFNEENKSQF